MLHCLKVLRKAPLVEAEEVAWILPCRTRKVLSLAGLAAGREQRTAAKALRLETFSKESAAAQFWDFDLDFDCIAFRVRTDQRE